jgi:hypothetical protein
MAAAKVRLAPTEFLDTYWPAANPMDDFEIEDMLTNILLRAE